MEFKLKLELHARLYILPDIGQQLVQALPRTLRRSRAGDRFRWCQIPVAMAEDVIKPKL
jgi:hypothetical protein